MESTVAFGSPVYLWVLLALTLGRACDLLSTWIATPLLKLEANPIARRLGWKGGLAVNAAVCLALPSWPLVAIVVATTSFLIAARNFKSAWIMRAMGELAYLSWITHLLHTAGLRAYLVCLAGETLLTAAVGGTVAYFGQHHPILLAVGLGIVAYAAAIAFYSLLAIRRFR